MKRILFATLAALALAGCSSKAPTEPDPGHPGDPELLEIIHGDVNNDGVINLSDLVFLSNVLNGYQPPVVETVYVCQ